MRRENLSVDEAAEAMAAIMSGEATPAQIGALLVGLTMKGERPAEIVGLAKTMRANAVQLSKTFDDVFDTCGTGGDRSGTFNISSAAALVAAAAGLARGEARQSIGVEPVRQRRRVRGARRQHRGRARGRRAVARDGRHRVLLCADVSSVDAACRSGPARARACGRRSICSDR